MRQRRHTARPDGDVQSIVGDAVSDVLADSISQRISTRSHALDTIQVSGIAAPLLSYPAAPPLRHPGASDNTPARLAKGLPSDADTLHATFCHTSDPKLKDTCKYYGLPVPRGVHKCAACRVSNMTRARTYHTSRGTETSHRVTFEFDLHGPVATQSRDGAKYLLVGVTQTHAGPYVVAAGQRRKSDFVGDDDVPSTFRALHASLKSRGIEIGTAIFDFGGEFNSTAAEAMLAQLGVAYRPRASDQHVDRVESEHRRIYEGMRPAMLTSGAPANLWLDCALDRCDKSNCLARDGVTPHEALFQTSTRPTPSPRPKTTSRSSALSSNSRVSRRTTSSRPRPARTEPLHLRPRNASHRSETPPPTCGGLRPPARPDLPFAWGFGPPWLCAPPSSPVAALRAPPPCGPCGGAEIPPAVSPVSYNTHTPSLGGRVAGEGGVDTGPA
jgi:hypothetical protein